MEENNSSSLYLSPNNSQLLSDNPLSMSYYYTPTPLPNMIENIRQNSEGDSFKTCLEYEQNLATEKVFSPKKRKIPEFLVSHKGAND
jgi:hypothetical protein